MADNKRSAIVEAAKNLLWRVGYESMSPRMVMQESGAGQGSLYHHFKGKKDVAVAALDEIEVEMRADVDAIFAADALPLDRIRNYLGVRRDGLKGCRLGRLATEQSITDEDIRGPIQRYFRHVEVIVKSALRESISRGELQENVDVGDVAVMLVAAVQGGFLLSRIHNDKRHMQAAMRGAAALIETLRT